MNVFLFELRRQARSIIAGTAMMLITLGIFNGGVYPIYSAAQEEIEHMLAGYPPEFLAAFGLTGDVFSYAGFFNFGYLYLALIAAIMAAAQAIAVFGREKRSHCSDFLLVRPISRSGVFAAKLGACLVGVAVSGLLFAGLAAVLYNVSGDGTASPERAAIAGLSILGIEIVFLSFGILAAGVMRRIRSVSGTASALGLLGFLLAMLPSMTGEEAFRVVSPFRWFDVVLAMQEGSYEAEYLALAAVVALLCIGIAYVKFVREDR